MSANRAGRIPADRKGNLETRQGLIDAAIQTILELGYYRASSNEIARRAGVSWGVIQYYFGTRERVLLAALEHAIERNYETLHAASVSGRSLAGRIAAYGDIIWDHYGSDLYLAHQQIVLNLLRDPTTAGETVSAMEKAEQRTADEFRRLLEEAAHPFVLSETDRIFVFAALRGLAVDELLRRTLHHGRPATLQRDHDLPAMADALAKHLTRQYGKQATATTAKR